MTHSKTFPVIHHYFCQEAEKSFREISGKGPDEKNYCIIFFPENSQSFWETRFGFRKSSQRRILYSQGASSQLGGLGAPKGIQTDRKQFGAAEKLRILGYGRQGHGVCRAGLGLFDPLGNEGNERLRNAGGLARRARRQPLPYQCLSILPLLGFDGARVRACALAAPQAGPDF